MALFGDTYMWCLVSRPCSLFWRYISQLHMWTDLTNLQNIKQTALHFCWCHSLMSFLFAGITGMYVIIGTSLWWWISLPHRCKAQCPMHIHQRAYVKWVKREREIKFIGLFENRGHRGPYSPYKPFNHNLYIGIIIFPHIDNPQYTGYD